MWTSLLSHLSELFKHPLLIFLWNGRSSCSTQPMLSFLFCLPHVLSPSFCPPSFLLSSRSPRVDGEPTAQSVFSEPLPIHISQPPSLWHHPSAPPASAELLGAKINIKLELIKKFKNNGTQWMKFLKKKKKVFNLVSITLLWGLPRWLRGKESACQSRRCGFDPWVEKIPWRRKWQPTPVFLPGESHRQRSLVGYSPWGHKESDRSEYRLRHSFMGEDFSQLLFHIGLFQTADYFLIFHGMQIKWWSFPTRCAG